MQVTFLIATERGGSNLITKILDAHPNICGPSPLHILRIFGLTFHRLGDLSDPIIWDQVIDALHRLLDSDFAIWKHKFTKQEIEGLSERGDLKSLLRQVYFVEVQENNKEQVFIKEIVLYKYYPFIQWLFPEAKYVYLVRDPRDVSLSWRKSSTHPGGLIAGANNWVQDQRQSIPLFASLAKSGRAILVRYEDLIGQKEVEVQRICEFMDVHYDDRMFDYHNDDLTRQNASLNPLWKNLSNSVMVNNSHKFETEMTKVEVAMVERICCDEMHFFGYIPKNDHSILSQITPHHIQKMMQKEMTKYPSNHSQIPIHEQVRKTLHNRPFVSYLNT